MLVVVRWYEIIDRHNVAVPSKLHEVRNLAISSLRVSCLFVREKHLLNCALSAEARGLTALKDNTVASPADARTDIVACSDIPVNIFLRDLCNSPP